MSSAERRCGGMGLHGRQDFDLSAFKLSAEQADSGRGV